jgi:uncharacterized SAM-binding protein YcdF (DUF218 family)
MSTQAELKREHVRRSPVPEKPRRGWGSAVALAVAGLLFIIVAIPFASAYHTVQMAHRHVTAPTDAIVVLGAAQLNGTPTPVFANRLDHARDLYESGVAPRIVTVGGKQPGDAFTEGEAGRDYLIEQGVPAEAITAIPVGDDTVNSLQAVASEMAGRGLTSATIVSDPTHMARSVAIADRLGVSAQPNPTSAGDGTNVTSEYVSRETLGYLYFALVEQWGVDRILPQSVA